MPNEIGVIRLIVDKCMFEKLYLSSCVMKFDYFKICNSVYYLMTGFVHCTSDHMDNSKTDKSM